MILKLFDSKHDFGYVPLTLKNLYKDGDVISVVWYVKRKRKQFERDFYKCLDKTFNHVFVSNNSWYRALSV